MPKNFPVEGCCSRCPNQEGEAAYNARYETGTIHCCPTCPNYEECLEKAKQQELAVQVSVLPAVDNSIAQSYGHSGAWKE
jgi:hypothetical protein